MFAAFLCFIAFVAHASDKPEIGKFEDWNDVSSVEVMEVFRVGEFSRLIVEPVDTSATPVPPPTENTFEPVKAALSGFNSRFVAALKSELSPFEVATVDAFPANPLPTPSIETMQQSVSLDNTQPQKGVATRHLILKLRVLEMDPGSLAARYWAGAFGAGKAGISVTGQLVESATGKSLVKFRHQVAGKGGVFGFGYDKLLKTLTEEVAENISELIKAFE